MNDTDADLYAYVTVRDGVTSDHVLPVFRHKCTFNFDSKSTIEQCSVCRRYWLRTNDDHQPTEWRLRNRADKRNEHRGRVRMFRDWTKMRDQHASRWAKVDRLAVEKAARRARRLAREWEFEVNTEAFIAEAKSQIEALKNYGK